MTPNSLRQGSSRKLPLSTNKVLTLPSVEEQHPTVVPTRLQRLFPESNRESAEPESLPAEVFSAPISAVDGRSPTTPPIEAYMDGALNYPATSTSKPNPNPIEQNALPDDTDELVQQLLNGMEAQNRMHDELARLDRQLDQQALAHSFLRATKNLDQKQPYKAREWVKHAEEITERLRDTENQARCLYWLGRIDWYEGHETDAYFHFSEAAKKLARGCDEMRRIPTYLEWLRPGGEKNKRRNTLARHGFHPPHETQSTRVSRKKVPVLSAVPHSIEYNRYSRPGLKRKREHMEPDVALALDLPRKTGNQNRREPRSRTVMTFESDRHVHPGDKVDGDPPRLHHLAYDFSWKRPQQLPHHPPSKDVFDFCRYPKGRTSRFRSHKIFTKQPWEDKVPKRTTRRTRTDVPGLAIWASNATFVVLVLVILVKTEDLDFLTSPYRSPNFWLCLGFFVRWFVLVVYRVVLRSVG